MKLSILVPCFNEEAVIEEFYKELLKTKELEKIKYEVIFIDDGSKDDTYKILEKISKKDKNVKVISFSRNFGKEAAMLAGMELSSGEVITIIDADLQQLPSTMIKMYEKLIDNKEVDVVASYRERANINDKFKNSLIGLFYKVNNRLSDVNILPGASDFRVFRRNVLEAIVSMKEQNRFLKGMFSWVGFNTIYVPYKSEERTYGTSKWSLRKLVGYGLGGILSFSIKPLVYISIISMIMFLIIIFKSIFNIALCIKLLFALLILFIGTISLYISRIYTNSLNRPIYIIKRTIGFN